MWSNYPNYKTEIDRIYQKTLPNFWLFTRNSLESKMTEEYIMHTLTKGKQG